MSFLFAMDTFKKCKVFFVHAAGKITFKVCLIEILSNLIIQGKNIYLWSLRFEPEGSMFKLWQENMLVIKPDIDDKLKYS